MKTAMRRDRRVRATIVVKHHVGGAEIAGILAAKHASGYGYTDGDTLTRSQVETIVRRVLEADGSSAYFGWAESAGESMYPYELARLHRWATGEIRRLFPELADAELDRFAAEHEQNED